MKRKNQTGFTIIELLIVIAIIGILATIVITNIVGGQEKARISKAESELQLIDKAILAMSLDLAKWPNGCTENQVNGPEVDIVDAESGLFEAPPVGFIDTNCEWTSADVSSWSGPYLQDDTIIDPWDNSYIFDPDYYPWQSCSSKANLPVTAAVVTFGADATRYTCDDIYRPIIR